MQFLQEEEGRIMVQGIFTFAWLILLSVEDVRKKEVHKVLLLLGAVCSVMACALGGCDEEWKLWRMVKAAVPGALMLAIAVGTKKAGMADGIVLICLGLLEGYRNCICMTVAGLVVIAVCSGVLLVLKKVNHNTELPFLPFLTIGWVMMRWINCYG